MSNVLVGGAIGDALGMPFETMLSNNELLTNWDGKTFLPSKHHKLQATQWTDDTQLSVIVAQSLIENSGFNPDDLSQKYVQWMFSGKARGFGNTTLMAMKNIAAGKHWTESGIVGSFGNGTAMRAAPFGVYFRNDLYSLVNIVKIDSAITHISEEAEAGAIAIALAAAYAVNNDLEDLTDKICKYLPTSNVKNTIYSLPSLLDSTSITPLQALSVLGTSANVKETVPAALYCFLKFDNYMEAIQAAIRAGRDTDTTAAIVGALFGAKSGLKGIDKDLYKVEDFDKLMALDSQLYNRTSYSFFPRMS